MKIGIPKEIKPNENRVAITPAGVYALTQSGHQLFVETNAGSGSGISDEQYIESGAVILETAAQVFESSDMIVKVKEPIEQEYKLIRKDQIVFTYFHFASSLPLTKAMIESKAVCIAYETVELPDKSLPLLVPMSEVAGRMAVQEGAKYLEQAQDGKGILLGGVPGVRPAHVLVIGGGIVGSQAAKIAAGIGASVTILDTNLNRLRHLNDIMPANVVTQFSDQYTIQQLVKTADLIVGAVLSPGAKAPVVIKRDMLKTMQPGTVLVDVAVDQGGCFETTKPTTHTHPTYVIDGVVHYSVANMPGAVPMTSTLALTNATLPYIKQLADKGWKQALSENESLRKGLNIVDGNIVFKGVAEAFGLPFTSYEV
ncbi:MAG: alanine dehydrogenase [Dysgonamonadaceae bacterium]